MAYYKYFFKYPFVLYGTKTSCSKRWTLDSFGFDLGIHLKEDEEDEDENGGIQKTSCKLIMKFMSAHWCCF